jgi:hypothetical protein
MQGMLYLGNPKVLVFSLILLRPKDLIIFLLLMLTGTTGASFSHQESWYLVESRARVIIFDMSTLDADNAFQQRSSLVPHSADHPHRPLSREHGLMSWPENFYKPMQRKQNCEGIDRKANSLSARAMQLGIYGSMVCSVHTCSLEFVRFMEENFVMKRGFFA